MALEPWVIEELENEERKQREEDRPSQRIDLPQSPEINGADIDGVDIEGPERNSWAEAPLPMSRIEIVPLSPQPGNTFAL